MNTSLLLPLYASIGFVEWALALLRTILIIRFERDGKPIQASLAAATVALETFVAMIVFANYATTGDWWIAGAYSLGSAFGSLIPLLCTKRRKEESHD